MKLIQETNVPGVCEIKEITMIKSFKYTVQSMVNQNRTICHSELDVESTLKLKL